MRIIAGKHGGRVLKVPEFSPTRPTTNIAKEALFNSLENLLNNIQNVFSLLKKQEIYFN